MCVVGSFCFDASTLLLLLLPLLLLPLAGCMTAFLCVSSGEGLRGLAAEEGGQHKQH
jgi:hypothetical protein